MKKDSRAAAGPNAGSPDPDQPERDDDAGDDAHEGDDDGEEVDPRLEAGWQALEGGDLEAARAAVAAVAGDDSLRLDAQLLDAAVAREEGDVEGALAKLGALAREDPDWCTPELWMAELLAEDDDRLDEALRHARRALDRAEEEVDYLDALASKAAIELALERPTEARKTLRGLPAADVPLDDPEAAVDFAQLLLDAGDPREARERLEVVTAADPEHADAWYLLGAAAEASGDEEAKRAAWVRTRALDLRALNEAPPPGPAAGGDGEGPGEEPFVPLRERLSEDALIEVAEETLAELPDELRGLLANVPIVVADLPAAADVAAGLDPRLLGLFSGTPHAESQGISAPATLTEIVLFRGNLARMAHDLDVVREEVRVTLLHEAGHFFGLDEAGLARLGLD